MTVLPAKLSKSSKFSVLKRVFREKIGHPEETKHTGSCPTTRISTTNFTCYTVPTHLSWPANLSGNECFTLGDQLKWVVNLSGFKNVRACGGQKPQNLRKTTPKLGESATETTFSLLFLCFVLLFTVFSSMVLGFLTTFSQFSPANLSGFWDFFQTPKWPT